MTQQAEGSPQTTLRERLSRLLDGPVPLDKRALLDSLYAEVTTRETRAYTLGWNDALTEMRGAS
ncbi:hypothetical protein J7F03_02135 [Streptomyces sp. ISL-43]|uniref:hypothetical protein n=1 Tax=Streptomyces sp. ISL-43 TaxID=2819183 RepID=UPI001BEBA866|nr:hypothetical protein [Streptomyces sp. ISL-43]MBT2445907.1 hypothetical protein [Streptomyces sp. ISL-43]